MMDEMLGYPTEFQPRRLRIALGRRPVRGHETRDRHTHARKGFPPNGSTPLRCAHGAADRRQCRRGRLFRLRRPRQSAANHTGLRLGARRPRRPHPAERRGDGLRAWPAARCGPSGPRRGISPATKLVVAAGPQTGVLSAMLETEVPVAPARAEMIVTEPLPLMPMGGVDGNGLYGRQTLRGNLAYGGGPHEWLEAGGMRSEALKPSSPLCAQRRQAPRGAFSQGRPCARHPHLGRHHREHAGRPAGDRPPADSRQRHGRHHVERRLRPVAGERAAPSPKSSPRASAASPISPASACRASAISSPTGANEGSGHRRRAQPHDKRPDPIPTTQRPTIQAWRLFRRSASRATKAGRRPGAIRRRNRRLRRHHHRRRRPRARDRLLSREGTRHHQCRGAGERADRPRQYRPQHHHRALQLPVAGAITISTNGR